MDLNSIEVQWRSFRFCVNRHYQLQFDECQSYSEIVDVYDLPVCFRIPGAGTGTWSICSRRASTASKSSSRPTSTGSHQQTTDGATSRCHTRVSSSAQRRGKASTRIFFLKKTCTYFISPRLQSEFLQVIRACFSKPFGLL